MELMTVIICYKCGKNFESDNPLRNWCNNCNEYVKEENKKTYKKAYNEMQQVFLKESIGISLYEILEQIIMFNNKDFIFNFINTKEIQDVIGSIKGMYKVNREEVYATATLVITDFFLDGKMDLNKLLDDFTEDKFIKYFKGEIRNRTKKMMREQYNMNEIPLSTTSIYENFVYGDFEKTMVEKIDLINALKKIAERNRCIIKSKFYDGFNEKEIGEENNLSRQAVNKIIHKSTNEIKKYLIIY
jgi:RNA polymerase sigma factor (sigma-70 family)